MGLKRGLGCAYSPYHPKISLCLSPNSPYHRARFLALTRFMLVVSISPLKFEWVRIDFDYHRPLTGDAKGW